VVRNFLGPDRKRSEWGFEWAHLENDLMMGQPREPVIRSWRDLDAFAAPDASARDRFDAMEAVRAEFGDGKYYKADLVLSGFTVMSFLRGFAQLLEDLYLEREQVERLADIVFGFEEDLIRRLPGAGFDAVGFADDWGTQRQLFISPALWREVFKPRYRRQFELCHACGLHAYFHCCGSIGEIIPDLVEIGLDILNPGQPNVVGIRGMGERYRGKVCFACPVSYQTTGISGSGADIAAEVGEMIAHLADRHGGLIGIVPRDLLGLGGSEQNIRAMFSAFRGG
jgi:uroporphyrinogen decarboxylase